MNKKKKSSLSVSQRQAVIQLTEKPNKDKRLIQNWRSNLFFKC